MKKVLLVARLGKFFLDFELSNIRILQEMGYEVWCAANFTNDNHRLDSVGVKKIHIELERSPVSRKNLRGYRQLIELMKRNQFHLVHCHMPIGGVFARMAAHKTQTAPVFYTAHGFHFTKGGPKRDWLLFYPIEKYLSRYTDVLITINHEDYALAEGCFRAGRTIYLEGIGIDSLKFASGVDRRRELCRTYAIPSKARLLLSVGELSRRKNHEVVLRGLALLKDESYHYLICGVGALKEYLQRLTLELGLEKQVHFLGWRDDIADLCKSADIFVFPSIREGLPVALMEAMAAGLPVIAAKARGNTELVKNHVNGILCNDNKPEAYADAIREMEGMEREPMIAESRKILEPYQQERIQKKMRTLYQRYLEGDQS